MLESGMDITGKINVFLVHVYSEGSHKAVELK